MSEFTEHEKNQHESEQPEEIKGIPFGVAGANFLCNLLQYALFLGFTMIILMIIRIFMPTMLP